MNYFFIINFLSFFWRYISFFRCFFIMLIYNCSWIILLLTFWKFYNFISNFITNQITSCSCCFWNDFFEEVLIASVADCLAWSKSFWRIANIPGLYLPPKLLLIFSPMFLPIPSANDRNHHLFQIFYFLVELNLFPFFIFYSLINTYSDVYFIFSFYFIISSGVEFWSVNFTSVYEDSDLKVFKKIIFFGEISNNWPNDL